MKAAGAVRELAEVVVRVVHERQPHALGAGAVRGQGLDPEAATWDHPTGCL